jgi:hypothetical protein
LLGATAARLIIPRLPLSWRVDNGGAHRR